MNVPNRSTSLTIEEVKTCHRRLAILRALAGIVCGGIDNLIAENNWKTPDHQVQGHVMLFFNVMKNC